MDPVFRAAEFYKKSRGETSQSAPSASEKQTHHRQAAAAGGGGKRPPSPPDREGHQAGNDTRWQQSAASATSSSTAEGASQPRSQSPSFWTNRNAPDEAAENFSEFDYDEPAHQSGSLSSEKFSARSEEHTSELQ